MYTGIERIFRIIGKARCKIRNYRKYRSDNIEIINEFIEIDIMLWEVNFIMAIL